MSDGLGSIGKKDHPPVDHGRVMLNDVIGASNRLAKVFPGAMHSSQEAPGNRVIGV